MVRMSFNEPWVVPAILRTRERNEVELGLSWRRTLFLIRLVRLHHISDSIEVRRVTLVVPCLVVVVASPPQPALGSVGSNCKRGRVPTRVLRIDLLTHPNFPVSAMLFGAKDASSLSFRS